MASNISLRDILESKVEADITEYDRSGVVQRRWHINNSNSVSPLYQKRYTKFASSFQTVAKVLSDSFLPTGYPNSVSSDYLVYQACDSLQAFFSTLTGLLSHRAILEGLGVGDADRTATMALLLTTLQNFTSRVATIVFAHRFGLSIEPECKRYRFLADVFNDCAFFLLLFSPLVSSRWWTQLVVLCTSSILQALCGVAGGASKASLSSHFARQDNLAELNTKEASQETAVGLIGLLVGSVLVRMVEDRWVVLGLMVTFVAGHLSMNYLGVRVVQLRTLNRQRATILMTTYLQTNRVPSPAEVAKQEAILFWRPVFRATNEGSSCSIKFASDIRDVVVVPPSMSRALVEEEQFIIAGFFPLKSWFSSVEFAQDLLHRCSEGSMPGGFRSYYKDESFLKQVAQQGWQLDVLSLETGRPIRCAVEVGKESKKDL